MRSNMHPDFCRTIKGRDRRRRWADRKQVEIYPAQSFMEKYIKKIGNLRIYTHSFSYHVTKGWRVIARNWRDV